MEEIDRRDGVEALRVMFNNETDVVWGEFTRSDLDNILSRTDIPGESSAYDLFELLRRSILIDNGRKSFWLDEWTGKKCFMVSARELYITWGADSRYWTWVSHPNSRFEEVANLLKVCWLDIKGKLKTTELSPNTTYVAYLIFKMSENPFGFDPTEQNASVIVEDQHSKDARDQHSEDVVHLRRNTMNRDQVQTPSTSQNEETNHLPYRRKDGWYEVFLGEFFNKTGNDEEVVARWFETERLHWKGGLLVEGIEFRPKKLKNNP